MVYNCTIPKSVVILKFHIKPRLSKSEKLPQDHTVLFLLIKYSIFGMKDIVSFHLIISFNFNWNGFQIEQWGWKYVLIKPHRLRRKETLNGLNQVKGFQQSFQISDYWRYKCPDLLNLWTKVSDTKWPSYKGLPYTISS